MWPKINAACRELEACCSLVRRSRRRELLWVSGNALNGDAERRGICWGITSGDESNSSLMVVVRKGVRWKHLFFVIGCTKE